MFLFKKYPKWTEIFDMSESEGFSCGFAKITKNVSWYFIIGMILSSIFYDSSNIEDDTARIKMQTLWPIFCTNKLIDDTIQYIKGHEVRVEWPEGEDR